MHLTFPQRVALYLLLLNSDHLIVIASELPSSVDLLQLSYVLLIRQESLSADYYLSYYRFHFFNMLDVFCRGSCGCCGCYGLCRTCADFPSSGVSTNLRSLLRAPLSLHRTKVHLKSIELVSLAQLSKLSAISTLNVNSLHQNF